MKKSLPVLLFFSILISYCSPKSSSSKDEIMNLLLLNERSNKVTLEGRAMKGRIKSGIVKVVPLGGDGKCDQKNPLVLGLSSTDEKGNYSVKYDRSGTPICVFVLPSSSGNTKMFDEFTKGDIDWSGDSFLVSVMNEPNVANRRRTGLSISPFTRFAAGRLEALAQENPNATNVNSLVSRSNREVAARFGIRRTGLSRFLGEPKSIDDYPEISELEIDFDDPTNPNTLAKKAILGGLSVLANQTKSESGFSANDVEEVLNTFSSYVASGRNDGRDREGNVLKIPGSDVPLGNNALNSVIASAVNTFIQSGGAEQMGVTPSQITNAITLQDKLPETTTTVVADSTPPRVLSFSPSNGATEILPNASMTIVFSEAIDDSITSLNVQSSNGLCRGTIQVSKDDFLNCVGLSVNSSTNPSIVLSPLSSMDGSSTYKIRVTPGLVDRAINAIALTTSEGFRTVDTTVPFVTSVTSTNADGLYMNGSTINVRLSFNAPVNVTGTPRILLNLTPGSNYADYVSGTGTNTLDFSYIIGTANSSDLDVASVNALELNGGTITNYNGLINAGLLLPSPGGPNSLGANKNINVDNSPPVVNFASAGSSVSESTGTHTITIQLSKPYYQPVDVAYNVSGGTATLSADYIMSGATVTFAVGETSKTITASINEDALFEGNETFNVNLVSTSIGSLGAVSTHTVTILDNDPAVLVEFASAGTSGSEATTTVNIPVTLSALSAQTTTVNYAVTGGTATSGSDFTLASGTLTIPAGQTTQNISLSVVNDTLYEANETVIITLSSPVNASMGAMSQFTYTINDDDAMPTVAFTAATSSGMESVTSVTIPVSLSSASGVNVTVNYSVTGGTATSGADFTLTSGTLTFTPGTTTQNISLTVNNDTIFEPNETVVITLDSSTGSTLGTNTSHTYTIQNDDIAPTVAFNTTTSSGMESVTSVNIPVSLSSASGVNVTVDYSVTGGTATSGTDYTLANGTLTFAPGTTTQNISLTVNNDTIFEANETVIITLATPTNSTLGTNTAHTYTIENDDTAPTVAFSAATSSGMESVTSVNIPVSLSSASGVNVTVNYSVTGGTATGSGTDFTLTSGTLTFTPGATTQDISLTVVNETLYEANETVTITLSSPTGSTLGANTAHTYTIENDDTPPTVQFAATTLSDSESVASINPLISLSAASSLPVTVNYTITGGTATPGTDFNMSPGTLTFNPGETSKSILLLVVDDLVNESNETIIIGLSSPTGATLGAGTSFTHTIQDNDFLLTNAYTLDCNANGKIDHYRLVFASNVNDASFPGYSMNALGSSTTDWQVAGYSNVSLRHGTSVGSICAGFTDTVNDNTLYLAFDEGAGFDTGAKPDLTTSATPGLTGTAGTLAIVSTATVAEADTAKPVVVSITPTSGASNVGVASFLALATFSEDMNVSTFTNANFTLTGASGVTGTVSGVNSNSVQFVATNSLAYSQSHTISLSNMQDSAGNIMYAFNSNFTTSQKNRITGNITNGGTGITVALSVNGNITSYNGTTDFATSNLLGIGDAYSAYISSQPPGKVCQLISDASNPAGGTFSGTTDIAINVNCVDGFLVSGNLTNHPPAPIDISLFQGSVGTIAGTGSPGSADGAFGSASFTTPIEIVSSGSSFLIADYGNHKIRLLDPSTGQVSTLAGTGTAGGADGVGTSASFNGPVSITFDGTYYYIAEMTGHRIRRMRAGTWAVDTLAGNGTPGTGDGVGTAAKFNNPRGMALVGKYLFIADRGNHRIRRLDVTTKEVITIAGNGTGVTVDNASGTSAQVNGPTSLVLYQDYIYFQSPEGHNIRKVSTVSPYSVTTIAGSTAQEMGYVDAVGTAARFNEPHNLFSDGTGNLYVTENAGKRIRRIHIPTGKVTTIAGNGTQGANPGVGIAANMHIPMGMSTDGKSIVFVDAGTHLVRIVGPAGLTHYYPLRGNPNDYIFNNHLTVVGSPTPTTGTFNEANGAYNIGAGNGFKTNPITATSNVSMTGWVKINSYATEQIIFYNGNSGASGYGFHIDPSGEFRLLMGGVIHHPIFPKPTTGVWTHLSLVGPPSPGGRWRAYMNGKEILSVNASPNTPAGFMSIGISAIDNQNLDGSIADVRVYNRILNEGEINELAQNSTQANVGASYSTAPTGLIVNFPFTNGSNNSNGAIPDPGLTGGTVGNANGRDGEPNGARVFNGTSDVLSTSTPYGLPYGNAPRTLCAWVNPSDDSGNRSIVSYGVSGANTSMGIGLYNNQYKIWNYGTPDLLSTPNVKLNTWQHFCGVYDGTNGSIYVDGKQLASGSIGPVNTSVGNLFIGRNIDDNSFYAGKLDDVRIYNSALTLAQIRQLATQIPAGLVARYDMNGDANDVSGFGNNATTAGTVSFAANGIRGNAMSITNVDGNHITASDINLPKGNAPRTLCAWYRMESDGGTPDYTAVPIGYGGASARFALWFQNKNLVRLWTEAVDLNATVQIPYFIWRHVCLVYNAPSATVYVNGRAIQSGSPPINTSSSGQFFIGNWITSRPFGGQLDEVVVYNRPLAEPEIRALSGAHPMQIPNWNPTIASSSLKFHLQADSLSNLADNAIISGWQDTAGGFDGSPFGSPTYLSPGINGKPAVNFNGSSQYFSYATANMQSTTSTLFAVFQRSGLGDAVLFANTGITGLYEAYFDTSHDFHYVKNGLGPLVRSSGFSNTSTPYLMTIQHDQSSSAGSMFLSEGSVSVTTTNASALPDGTPTGVNIGASPAPGSYMNGKISELIYFHSFLTTGERVLVNCYLSTKYGIPLAGGVVCP